MGGLSLADALSLCELLANTDVARYERAALRWLQRFIDEACCVEQILDGERDPLAWQFGPGEDDPRQLSRQWIVI
jgi:hypothetical protein